MNCQRGSNTVTRTPGNRLIRYHLSKYGYGVSIDSIGSLNCGDTLSSYRSSQPRIVFVSDPMKFSSKFPIIKMLGILLRFMKLLTQLFHSLFSDWGFLCAKSVPKLRVCFLGKSENWALIQDLFGSRCVKGTEESFLRVDSSVPLIHHDPNDLGSMFRFRIYPQKNP